MKSNPKTSADLKFNWIFDLEYKTVEETKAQFEKLNSNLVKYKIKSGKYKFICKAYQSGPYRSGGNIEFNDLVIWFHVTVSEPLSHLIDSINYRLHLNLRQSGNFKPLKLLKFELISETEFKIHVEESKE